MPHPPRRDETALELPLPDPDVPLAAECGEDLTPALLPGAACGVQHPQRWTEDQVRAWWEKRTKRSREVEALSKGTDGRNIMRWNQNRFEQMCKGDSHLAAVLYQDLRNEVQRFEHYRKTGVVLKAPSISPKPGPGAPGPKRRASSLTRATPTGTPAARTQPLTHRNGPAFNPADRDRPAKPDKKPAQDGANSNGQNEKNGNLSLKPKLHANGANGASKFAASQPIPMVRAPERKTPKAAVGVPSKAGAGAGAGAQRRTSSNGASRPKAAPAQATANSKPLAESAPKPKAPPAEPLRSDSPPKAPKLDAVVTFCDAKEPPLRRRSLVMEDLGDLALHQLSTPTRVQEKMDSEKPQAMDDTAVVRRPKSARLAGDAKGKEAETEDATRQMFDKRELRKRHKGVYEQHIRAWVQRRPGEEACPADACRVRVYVRKRPLFPHEEEAEEFDVATVEGRKIIIHNCLTKADLRSLFISHMGFQFADAFHESASDDEVYQQTAAPAVQHVLGGNIAALFMFGQTGSGKTHTMSGLLQRAASHIFLQEQKVTLTAFEIAGKVMRDLLDANPKELKIREDKGGRTQIVGLHTQDVSDPEQLLQVMRQAQAHRATRATQVNETSSRSHAVFRIFKEVSRDAPAAVLTLVDCAGSERREDTTQHDARSRRDAAEINSTIFALKECFRVMRSAKGQPPYRESLLTRVLSDSFASEQAMVVAIGTVSPSATDTEHSIGTLRALQQLQGTQMIFDDREDILKQKPEVDPKEAQTHPKTWSEAEVRQWLQEAAGGKAKAYAASLSKGTDGKNLLRWPNQRFVQLCDGDEDLGNRLYQELRTRMK